MKKSLLFTLFLFFAFANVRAQQLTVEQTIFDHDANADTFAFGADISWLSQQESWGTYYCNRQGKRTDLMTILKEDFGINALRFRVWVNPSGGWSGKQDVINLCKRAHAKGFKIMISFHYSDTWADSGSQTIPAQWTDHSADALAQKVYEHTKDVLTGLKAVGIVPVWVSLGNETKYGMLYETGRTKTTEGVKNFVRFINEGARAVKEISEDIITIIHLPNGHDESTARSMFDNLKKYGANYDCIGLSAYPRWSHLDVTNDAQVASAVNKYITVFRNLRSRFGKPVMVMETGHYGTEPLEANRFLAEFMKALINDGDLGCFYWEPEAFDNGGYNLGAWSAATHQGTIAMDAFRGIKHTAVDYYATARITAPFDTLRFEREETVQMRAYAKTSTTVTSISKVDFYLNKKRVHSLTPQGNSPYFTYETDTLPKGIFKFYAVVTDNQDHTANSDTVCFLVDQPVVLQENAAGFLGCSDPEVTVARKVSRYTGGGYMPATHDRETSLSWEVTFPAAGDYDFYLRYHSDVTRIVKFFVDDNTNFLQCAFSPQNRWTYVRRTITVETPGRHVIRVQGSTEKGYPDIDFLGITSPEGVGPVHGGDFDGLGATDALSTHDVPKAAFDLSGQRVVETSLRSGGIYVIDGRKVMIR
ncbi:MAG: glycosyl hydrolase 53 family protein [Bacteroidales bacterium]|nr:glycosyl hydrolase 53 family protein [Bacteroidales bacterium]